MNKLKLFFLTAAMLLSSLSLSAHDFVKDGIYYELPKELDLADPVVAVTYMGRYYDSLRMNIEDT